MKKYTVSLLVASLLLSTLSEVVGATSVTGVRSLNNEERMLDYKVSDSSQKEIYDSVTIGSDTKDTIPSSSERSVGDLITGTDLITNNLDHKIPDENFKSLVTPVEEQQLSWLVENNIVSRENKITVDPSAGITVGREEYLYDRSDPLAAMNKSDFLVGAYKSLYGVLESRPLIIKTDSWRDASEQYTYYEKDEDGKDVAITSYHDKQDQKVSSTGSNYKYTPAGSSSEIVATFPEGDYYTLVSPDVYELYFKELVDKKIIPLSSIIDTQFQSDYASIAKSVGSSAVKTYPRWYKALGPYMVSTGVSQPLSLVQSNNGSSVWGKSYKINSEGSGDISQLDRGYINGKVVVEEVKSETSKYFFSEVIDSMSALKYVESMLRLTEKDMTDTEARIISYKYGATYLDSLQEEDRKTIMFLTAKGILNFEDQTEYKNLYSSLPKDLAYKVLYRLANKNARLNFGKIQLTDADNAWIQQGFNELSISMNYLNDSQASTLLRSDGTYEFSPIPDVQTGEIVEREIAVKDTESKTFFSFLGLKVFSKSSRYAAPAANLNKEYTITKIFDSPEKYKYRGVRLTDLASLKKAQWVVSATYDQTNKKTTVVFKLNSSSSYVASSSINSGISVGTDYLFNTSSITAITKFEQDGKEITLVPASIFRDNGPELGQKILVMSDKVLKNIETGTTAVLLQESNTALIGTHVINSKDLMVTSINGEIYYNLEIIRTLLSNTYISSLDPNSMYVSSSIIYERLANVVGSTGNSIGKTYVMKFNSPELGGDIQAITKYKFYSYVNISQLSTSSNFLVRKFDAVDETGKSIPFTVIMQLQYILPDKSSQFLNPIYAKSNPTFTEVNDFIYTRPKDAELADWWDNNISLSNAFANVFYGTKGVQYVKSGYLAPSISVLYDSPGVIKEKHLLSFLQEVGAQLPEEWATKFVGTMDSYNKVVTATTDKDNAGSKYYPTKSLTKNSMPKWVHAMFNNDAGASKSLIFGGTALTTNGVTRSNTELWRDLMVNRTFSLMASTEWGDHSKFYMNNVQTFIETNGGAIYTRIDDSDGKYPSKLIADGKVLDDVGSFLKVKEFTFKPQTRTATDPVDNWVGKTVTDPNGNKFVLNSVSGNKLIITDLASIQGNASVTKRGTKDFYEITGKVSLTNGTVTSVFKTAIKTRYNDLRKVFTFSGTVSGYGASVPEFEKATAVTSFPDAKTALNKTLYIDAGADKLDKAKSKVFYNGSSGSYTTFSSTSSPVYAHVRLELDANYWTVNESGKIVARRTNPNLQVGNIYFSSINQGVIDSIIYKYISAVSVDNLKDGSTLMVGDIKLTKRGDYFVSDPQENISSWKSLIADAENPTKVRNGVLSAFAGLGISLGTNGKPAVSVSGIPIPLSSFVKEPKLAVPLDTSKTINLLAGSSVGKATVYKYKDGKFTTVPYSKQNVPSVGGVVFSVKLTAPLLARKLDNTNDSYELLMSTNTSSDGYMVDVPFFNEDLNLSSAEDMTLMASKTNFKPVANAQELKDNFMTLSRKAFMGDLQSLSRILVALILSYIIIMSWIIFMILKYGLFAGLLDIIKDPGRDSNRKGVDLLKVISFGMFSTESDMSALKLVVSNLLMFVIIDLLLTVNI